MSPHQARTGSMLSIATVWVYVGSFALEPPVAFAVGAALPALALLSLWRREPEAFQLALFCVLAALGCLLLPVGVSMPGLLAGILTYLLLSRKVPQLSGATSWLRAGKLTPVTGALMALTVMISAVGLYGWIRLLQPDVVARPLGNTLVERRGLGVEQRHLERQLASGSTSFLPGPPKGSNRP